LNQKPVDITPSNKNPHFIWNNKDLNEFENEWNFKPVQVRGIFDHDAEIQVEKMH